MNTEYKHTDQERNETEDPFLQDLDGLDAELVAALTGKPWKTKGSKAIGIATPIGVVLLADVITAARLYAEDPQQIDRSLKLVRASVNGLIQMFPTNTPLIESKDPWVIAGGAVGAIITLLGVGYLGKKAADIYSVFSTRREMARDAARVRLESGHEQVTKQDHTVVVWFEQNGLVDRMKPMFNSPVLLSNGASPYDGLAKNRFPAYAIHVAGESGDDTTLEKANIVQAAELVLFPLPTDNLLVDREDRAEVIQDRMKRALDTAISAIEIRHTQTPDAYPLDIILIAPKKFQVISGSPMDSVRGEITPKLTIQEYIATYAEKFGLSVDKILKHFHIIDPSEALVESLSEFKDKTIAIAGDANIRAALAPFFKAYGLNVQPYGAKTEYVITYEKDNQRVVIHPAILTGVQQGLGFFVNEQGKRVKAEKGKAKVVSVHDRSADVEGEVLFSQPIDFESAFRAEITSVLDDIQKSRISENKEAPKFRTIYISPRDSGLQEFDPYAGKDMEFKGSVRALLTEVLPAVQTIENFHMTNGWGVLEYERVSPIHRAEDMSERSGLRLKDVGPANFQFIQGPFEFRVRRNKKNRLKISLRFQSENRIRYLMNNSQGFERYSYKAALTVSANGELKLHTVRLFKTTKRFSRKGSAKEKIDMLLSRYDQMSVLEKFTDLLHVWNEERGYPSLSRNRRKSHAQPMLIIRENAK